MTNEELILEAQARAYRQVHRIAEPAAPPVAAPVAPTPAPAAPPPAEPAPLTPEQRLLLGHAQEIQQRQQQPGHAFGRHQLPPAMAAALAAQAAAPPAQQSPPAPSAQERLLAAMREERQAAKPVSQPGFGGFLRTPTLADFAAGNK